MTAGIARSCVVAGRSTTRRVIVCVTAGITRSCVVAGVLTTRRVTVFVTAGMTRSTTLADCETTLVEYVPIFWPKLPPLRPRFTPLLSAAAASARDRPSRSSTPSRFPSTKPRMAVPEPAFRPCARSRRPAVRASWYDMTRAGVLTMRRVTVSVTGGRATSRTVASRSTTRRVTCFVTAGIERCVVRAGVLTTRFVIVLN